MYHEFAFFYFISMEGFHGHIPILAVWCRGVVKGGRGHNVSIRHGGSDMLVICRPECALQLCTILNSFNIHFLNYVTCFVVGTSMSALFSFMTPNLVTARFGRCFPGSSPKT